MDRQLFDTEISESPLPVIIDFWADWCGTCRLLAPAIEGIAEDQADTVRVLSVDADANPDLCEKVGVRGLPTVLIYMGGVERARLTGTLNKRKILDALEAVVNA